MGSPYEPYLKQAEALFAAGDVVKAGQIWQAILKKDPGNEAARTGLYRVKVHFDARATQDGLGGPAEAAPPQPDRQTHTPPPAEINSLLEAGCALYDAGRVERAIATWELALRKDPDNALARGYIDGARRKLEVPEPVEAPAPAADAPDEADRLLRDGCTLYDMGQVEDALAKWERAHALAPDNTLVVDYINGARRDLGLAALEPGAAAAPTAPPAVTEAPAPPRDADRLVREGIQIYDLGMVEEAVQKWEQALALDPGHGDARDYLAMAERDRAHARPTAAESQPAPPAPPPAPRPPAPDPGVEALEARIRAAEHLLQGRKIEEAAFAFQQLLDAGAQDFRVIQGYQQARTLLGAQEEAPLPEAAPPPEPAPMPLVPHGVTSRPATRGGPKAPRLPGDVPLPEWLLTPRNLILAGAGLLAFLVALMIFRSYQRDAALRDAVKAARTSAAEPIVRKSQPPVLAELPADIRAEASRAVSDDPLTAYYRAQECLRLDPGDGAAALVLERARAGLAAMPAKAEGADLDRSLKDGDLDTARDTLLNRLRQAPDDPELKARARTVWLALVQARAAGGHFGPARELLVQGRAMFPQDRAWSARIRLLEQIQALPKEQRAAWIPLLG